MRSALVVVALTVACAALPAKTQQPTKRLALIVGIDQYESTTINDLQGCANDARDMKNLLRNRFEFAEDDVHVLLNEKATRANILSEFRTHLIRNGEGAVVVFHYSGHGSRVHDVSDDQEEIDGWDETIVPHDSRVGDVFDITDDELNALLRELLQKTTNVTVILDSCHSGSGFRATSVRRAPDDERTPPATPGRARGGREGTSDLRELALDYMLIAGARPNELANEFFTADEQQRGAMTYFLTRTLRDATGAVTYRDVRDAVSREVTNAYPSQHPLFEGLRIDHTIFGVDTMASEAYVLASPREEEEGTAAVEGGATYGWRTGAVLDVYPPRTKTFTGPPAAKIELTRVDAFESEGRITSGTVEPDSRAAIRTIVVPDQVLRIHYENAAQDPLVQAVKAKLADVGSIAAVDNPQQANLILKAVENGYAFHSPDLRQLSPAVAADAANAEKRLASQADQWARWRRILAIGNPAATPAIAVDIRKQGAARAASEFIEGDRIVVTVDNVSNRDLYITIVDLSDDGSSAVWYPEAGSVEFLAREKKLVWPVDVWVAEGRRSVVDTIKVFATTVPLNPAVFEQASVRSADTLHWSANPLAEFLERNIRGARGGTPARLDGWSTVSNEIVIRKDGPRLGGFIAHYEGRGDAALTTARSSLPACDGAVADCYDVRAFGAEGTSAEIHPSVAGRALSTRGTPASLGAAWEEAYRLREKTGATRVEPILELEVESLAPDTDASTRDSSKRPDKPGARNDNLWSLRHANVFAAWALLQAKGRADGNEGGGVVVAHPDTGYRKHAEIWNADANLSPITPAAGYDYVESKDDPFDPLDRGGVLPNPGHGTKSSSAIISPKGKQWTGGGPNAFVDGVAPGARLMPLRVNRSVVHFNPTRLAQAIYDAAGDDRTRVKKKADVVSISMGGVPSWGLHKAVRYAEQRGVIVVAAAGNEVGFVVWPARYPEVVGIAASNVECGIWAGSSRGSAVDMTAPGESVWHAEVDENARETVTMGQGTTYATATTAGIAALWLDYHRDDPGFSRLRSAGKLTSAFRDALRAAAWKPTDPPARRPQGVTCTDLTPWNAKSLGAGIVNAAAALRQPLPQTRSLSAEGDAEVAAEPGAALSDLPLFRSLFARGTDGAVVRERYRSIFGVPATRLQEAAIFEAEIVDQYALSEEVRAALENIIGPEPPTAAQYRAVRVELLRQDISPQLRSALEAASRSS